MEININAFFNNCAPRDYSASVAEIGRDAGMATWSAACEDAPDYDLLDTDEKREAYREHVKGYGAWTDNEIRSWSDVELNALFIQLVSGDMREFKDAPWFTDEEWQAYENESEAGQVSGRLFKGIDGAIYYYIGS